MHDCIHGYMCDCDGQDFFQAVRPAQCHCDCHRYGDDVDRELVELTIEEAAQIAFNSLGAANLFLKELGS